jgi:beta-lactamase class A
VDGASYPKAEVTQQLKTVNFSKNMQLTLVAQTTPPARTSQDVAALKDQAAKIIGSKLTLLLNGEQIVVPAQTVAGWITFSEDKNNDRLNLIVNTGSLDKYLKSIQSQVYIAPGVTIVNLRDGKEVSRQTGASGRGIDAKKIAKAVGEVFAEPKDAVITVPLTTLKPSTRYNRSYSQTPAGLQALLNYLADSKGDFGISVNELSGGSRTASVNGSKQYRTASTYKLFVAYSVLKRVEAKQWDWDDKFDGSKTIEDCFDLMIINSDNPCAEKFGETIGWTNIHNQMRSLGLSNTTLGATFLTTANDQALFLRKLQQGSLLKDSSQKKLLDTMRRQVYRAGIPAGVGVPVADKVGFLEGYLHDSAIVYAPGRTYVLVILSFGSSWSEIADAARQIQDYFNQ